MLPVWFPKCYKKTDKTVFFLSRIQFNKTEQTQMPSLCPTLCFDLRIHK